jgi:quercetin dioxygenase-like cupin family protein
VFEVLVPVAQKLAAPAHKNDAYEEILYGIDGVLTWTVDGMPIEVGPGQARCTASIISATRMRRSSPSYPLR